MADMDNQYDIEDRFSDGIEIASVASSSPYTSEDDESLLQRLPMEMPSINLKQGDASSTYQNYTDTTRSMSLDGHFELSLMCLYRSAECHIRTIKLGDCRGGWILGD